MDFHVSSNDSDTMWAENLDHTKGNGETGQYLITVIGLLHSQHAHFQHGAHLF